MDHCIFLQHHTDVLYTKHCCLQYFVYLFKVSQSSVKDCFSTSHISINTKIEHFRNKHTFFFSVFLPSIQRYCKLTETKLIALKLQCNAKEKTCIVSDCRGWGGKVYGSCPIRVWPYHFIHSTSNVIPGQAMGKILPRASYPTLDLTHLHVSLSLFPWQAGMGLEIKPK